MSQTSSQVDQDIRSSLLNINRLVLEAGDKEICDLLEKIIQSPDQISALHDAFSTKLKRATKKKQDTESAFNERHGWFRNFTSTHGERLETKDIDSLARITKHWELPPERINALLACSILWANKPELFWHGGFPDENITRSCYNDLERIQEVDPLRRRVLLIILSRQVQQQQQQVLAEGRRERARPRKPKSSLRRHRKRVFLPTALRSMTQQLWPELNNREQEYTRNKVTIYSRYGWKWRQLAPLEMVLSLQDSTVRGFERHAWSPIEIEAINLFMETLPQYRIQSHLRRALRSITSCYSRTSNSCIPLYGHMIDALGYPQIPAENRAISAGAMTPTSDSVENATQDQLSYSGNTSRISSTIANQCTPCPSLSENEESFHSSPRTSASANANVPSFEDAQAAEVLSSIPKKPRLWQSQRGFTAPEEPQHPSPVNSADIPHANQHASISRQGPSSEGSERALPSATQVAAEPEAMTLDQIPFGWGQSSPEFSSSIQRQQCPVFEIANPLSSWQSVSYQDLLDWGTVFPEHIPEDRTSYDDNPPEPVSNPLPPSENIPALELLDWNLSPSADGALFGEDYAMIDSVSNPLPPLQGTVPFPVDWESPRS